MNPSLRGAMPVAPGRPAARVAMRLARVVLALALILAATLPAGAGDRRRPQRAAGRALLWGEMPATVGGQPHELAGLLDFVAIAGGPGHGLALKTDGTVWAWGSNSVGQLGNGTTTSSGTPLQVSILENVIAIAGGFNHSLALKSDGTVWAWGGNTFGQLGNGTITNSNVPVPVSILSGVVAIAGGSNHSLALRSDGTVWAWGANDVGQLGNNPPWDSSVPVRVGTLTGVVAVAAGIDFSLALRTDGTVWAWGSGGSGQLGNGTTGNTSTPVQASGLSGAVAIASGSSHSLALKSDGTVWAWGANSFGALGNGTTTSSTVPVQVSLLSGAVAIAGAAFHSVALMSDGTVRAWGANDRSQLGNGSWYDSDVPVLVNDVSGAVAIAASGDWSLALKSRVLGSSWGSNANGVLGNNTVGSSAIPTAVNGLGELTTISAGGFHSAAVRSDGTLWTWGNNGYGEMGIGSGLPGGSTPTQIMVAGPRVQAVATGEHHSLAVTETGAVYAWGHNEFGQTANGTTLETGWVSPAVQYTPVWVAIVPDPGVAVVAVAAGAYHSLALDDVGSVWAWGANQWGQVGDGTYEDGALKNNRLTPARVLGLDGIGYLSGVTAVAAGAAHSLALKSDGTVWAWGRNSDGQLGTNGTALSPTPVQVVDPADPGGYLTGVVAIAAGSNFSVALKADGTVRAWGNNGIGQLGNSTVGTSSLVPVPVLATDAAHRLTGVVAIEAGTEHVLALKSNGLLLGWGWNSVGQLGNGTTTYEAVYTPVHVLGPQAPSVVSAGYMHSLALALTPTPDPLISGYITITADNQTTTYGGAGPGLTYTIDSLLTLDEPPACVSAGGGTSAVGEYEILCAGAAKAGYVIDYVPGVLSVNPAPLTIIADNKSMGAGGAVPLLTASYYGLVNGDTLTTIGTVNLTTEATAASAPGAYPITFATVPVLANYTVTTVPGTVTVNADLLTFNNNYFVTGDFAVGWAVMRAMGDESGFATTGITIPTLDPAANTVPAGADIVAAYLYWQAVEWSGFAPGSRGFFRDYAMTGQQLGSDLPFAPAPPLPGDPGGGGSMVMRMYRANVLPYLPLDSDGRRLAAGPHEVRLPEGGGQLPLNSGVSLVVIYRVLSPDFPLKAVVLYDGAWVRPEGLQLTVRGFYDADLDSPTPARVFNMASTAVGFMPELLTLPPPEGTIGQYSQVFQPEAGTAGGVHVFSIAVNDTDDDGLLDAWEAGPPAGDPHAGEPGYYEITDNSWVPLPGAVNGEKDMFVQLDYMCSAVNPLDGSCDPANSRLPQPDPVTGENPLLMVQQAFDASGIKLHYLIGHAIQEETCKDDLAATPPRLCQFPNEAGVVGWKTGLEVFKVWPHDPEGCVAGNVESCRPRFERGQKDSYHYVLFGNSLAVAAWNTRGRTLESIVVSGGEATIMTPPRPLLNGSTCPTRVTISGALGAPALNGVYDVSACPGDGKTAITIATPGVPDWSYTRPASAADEREPLLAVISGNISSISGYSDLGGADSAVTLGKWAPNPSQPQNTKANVQAGTLMHELGHSIGLAHGGAYLDTLGSYAPTYGANCKPNYQSVMNYLFQIDLLPGKLLAFSGQALDPVDENAGSASWSQLPAVNATRWYVPWVSKLLQGDAATRHCDGTPILEGAQMVREDHAIFPLTWASGADINFDGRLNSAAPDSDTAAMRGYDDLSNVDLRQVGATGGEYVSMAGLLGFGSGGTLTMGSGGTLALGSGGTLTFGSGGTFAFGSGGTLTMGSGGTLTFGSGGTLTFGSGGTLTLGSGGIITYGAGTTIEPGAGGTLVLGSGGILTMGSGGTLAMGSGGTLAMGSGGTLTFGSGGGSLEEGGTTTTYGAAGTLMLGSGGTLMMGSGGTLMMGSGGTLMMGSGGTLALGSGGTLMMGSGGTFTMGSGGTLTMGSGGTLMMGSGGTLAMGSGGIFTMGSGGTLMMGSGGTFALGSGGTFTMGSGGTLAMGSGGTFALGSGGTLALGSGGTLALGSGGTLAMGSGGTFAMGSGGVLDEMTYETANSVVRPPSEVTKTPTADGLRIDWQPPSFGVVSEYHIYYRVPPDQTLVWVGSVSGDPPPTTFLVTSPVGGAEYLVATTVAPDSESATPRSSGPSEVAILKYDQTIAFDGLPDRLTTDLPFTVTAVASSDLPVGFSAEGRCTVSGSLVSITGAGSCTITASQPGDPTHHPAPSVSRTFAIVEAMTIQGFHAPVSMPTDDTMVVNVVKGGSTVPLKFNLYVGTDEQTELSAVKSLTFYSVACTAALTTSLTDVVATTADTSLRYDGTQFVQNWKTPKTTGCYAVTMTAKDGSLIVAYFRLK